MSGVFPTVVTPDDVRASKARLDAFARTFNRSVATCSQIHPDARQSWSDFYRGWRQFADADASWFHAAAEFDTAQQYEEHLTAWQAQLAPICPIAGAPLTRPSGVTSGTLENTVKTVAIAGAVVAVALAVREITR